MLRRAGDADRGALLAILREPSVARWWGDDPEGDLEETLRDDEAVLFVVLVDGAVAGGIQYWEEDDPQYRHAGIDVFLGSAYQDRGLGTESVRVLARHLFEDRGHHRLTIDPSAENGRAIRAYEKVGFRPVGVMRQYERHGDGRWHDGLLMDMLRGELRDATS